MANAAKKTKRGFITYKSYVFKDKDPIIDALRTSFSESRLSLEEVHAASGVSRTTLYSWWYGKTLRPQFATVSAVALSLGKRTIKFHAGKPRFE